MNKFFTDKNSRFVQALRDIVFGLEDGMVSTLGAITGIAIGSQNHFTVVLSGLVIIAVESISMGIGSYVSNKSDRDRDISQLREQKKEIKEQIDIEKKDLINIYLKDGWSNDLATQMADFASQNKKLMLKEKALHELSVLPEQITSPKINGIFMFFSYVLGGMIALSPYLFFSVSLAMPVSIAATLLGLFLVGVFTSLYTQKSWFKSGTRVLLIGGLALLAGMVVGELAKELGIN